MKETIKKGLKDYQSEMLIGARADGAFGPPQNDVNAAILLRDFNAITATAYPFLWTGPFRYEFETFNAWVNWGEAHGVPIVMHMIAGPNQYYKDWAKTAVWNGPELEFFLYEYIRNLMTQNDNYRKVYAWNVTNEVLCRGNGQYRAAEDCFLEQMGWEADESGLTGEARVNDRHPRFIAKAYEFAGQFAKGKLELREDDFEFEPDGLKTRAMVQLIHHLRNRGLRVDAVGFQTHLYWNPAIDYTRLDAFQRNVEQFHRLGCEVYVTELDNPVLDDGVEGQSRRWEEFYRACRACGVEQVHTWGVADGVDRAWRDGTHPLLFDEQFDEKDAYFAVARALEGAF